MPGTALTRLSAAITYRQRGAPTLQWVPCECCTFQHQNTYSQTEHTWVNVVLDVSHFSLKVFFFCIHAAPHRGRAVAEVGAGIHRQRCPLGDACRTIADACIPDVHVVHWGLVFAIGARTFFVGGTNVRGRSEVPEFFLVWKRRDIRWYDGNWNLIGLLYQILHVYQKDFIQASEEMSLFWVEIQTVENMESSQVQRQENERRGDFAEKAHQKSLQRSVEVRRQLALSGFISPGDA